MQSLLELLKRKIGDHPGRLQLGDIVWEPSVNTIWRYLVVAEIEDGFHIASYTINKGIPDFSYKAKSLDNHTFIKHGEWPQARLLEEDRQDLVDRFYEQ